MDKQMDNELKDELIVHRKSLFTKPFRTVSHQHLAKLQQQSSGEQANSLEETEATFVYNLTNLMPNTKYVLELRARISHLESHASKALTFQTLRKFFNFLFCLNYFNS